MPATLFFEGQVPVPDGIEKKWGVGSPFFSKLGLRALYFVSASVSPETSLCLVLTLR